MTKVPTLALGIALMCACVTPRERHADYREPPYAPPYCDPSRQACPPDDCPPGQACAPSSYAPGTYGQPYGYAPGYGAPSPYSPPEAYGRGRRDDDDRDDDEARHRTGEHRVEPAPARSANHRGDVGEEHGARHEGDRD